MKKTLKKFLFFLLCIVILPTCCALAEAPDAGDGAGAPLSIERDERGNYFITSFEDLETLCSSIEPAEFVVVEYVGTEEFSFRKDFTLPENFSLGMEGDISVPSGVTLTNNGTINCGNCIIAGTLVNKEGFVVKDVMTVTGQILNRGCVCTCGDLLTGKENIYSDDDGELRMCYDVGSEAELRSVALLAETLAEAHESYWITPTADMALTDDFQICNYTKLVIEKNFIIPPNITFTNYGDISLSGDLSASATLVIDGSLINNNLIDFAFWIGSRNEILGYLELTEQGHYSGSGRIFVHNYGPVDDPFIVLKGFEPADFIVTADDYSWELRLAAERVPGDATGDGSVDIFDLLWLKKFLAGEDVDIDKSCAEVTGDGAVDIFDLLLLKKFLAGMDVTLS